MALNFFSSDSQTSQKASALAFVLVILCSVAQAQKIGKLAGKVTDASNNEPLSGVSIIAKSANGGTASKSDGTYILSLPVGIYTIRYSYSGYATKEVTGVEIKPDDATNLDILLSTSSTQLAGVVVTATLKRETSAAVYSLQKRSAASSDGISLEAIRKTPDNNAGQILRRVTGVNMQDNRFIVVRGLNDQFNQTMLNGVPMTSTETNRNAFAFDLIPASVIDNITINKTATPDMPGNFAGGIVQVNTKDFPAKDFYSVTVGAGFSDGTIGKDFYSDKRAKFEILGFGAGIRELPKGFPTLSSRVPLLYMNVQEQTRYLKMLPNNLAPINHGPSRPNESIQLAFAKTVTLKNNSQIGIVAAVSQRKIELTETETTTREPIFSDNLRPDTLSGLGYYSENRRYRYSVDLGGVLNLAYRFGNNKITLKNLYTQVFTNMFISRPVLYVDNTNFPTNGQSQLVGYSYVAEQKGIVNSILSGEHRTGINNETRLEWNVNVTSNSTKTPDTRNFLFTQDSTGFLKGNQDASFTSSLIGFSRIWSSSKDRIHGGAFNITSPFQLGTKHLFKAGILFQNRLRSVSGTVLPIAGLSGMIKDVFEPASYSPDEGHVVTSSAALASGSSNYKAGSNLLAAYESIENKVGASLRIIWGARIENYQQNINVYSAQFYADLRDPELYINQAGARTTFNFLPSVNVVYSPISSINIRGAFSSTVIRPELKDIAAFSRYDLQSFALTQGNKYLKSSAIENYDLKVEWFPSSGEIFSVSAFAKQIKEPIEYARGKTGQDYERFRTPVNSGDATVQGLEAEIRKKLNFLNFAKWLDHVSFFGNASLLKSNVQAKQINNEYFSTVGEHRLTGQANYIINSGVSILLLKNTFELTFSYNRTGDYTNELGSSDYTRRTAEDKVVPKIPPFIVQARDLADVVITQSLFKERLRIKFNVNNVLNKRYVIYQDLNGNGKFDDAVLIDRTKPENNYLGGIDNAPLIVAPQRSYMLNFTYTF